MPTHLHLRRWHRRISCGCRQHLEAIRELAREGARLLLISGLEIGGRDLDAGVLLPVLTVGEVADQCEERPDLAPGVDEVDVVDVLAAPLLGELANALHVDAPVAPGNHIDREGLAVEDRASLLRHEVRAHRDARPEEPCWRADADEVVVVALRLLGDDDLAGRAPHLRNEHPKHLGPRMLQREPAEALEPALVRELDLGEGHAAVLFAELLRHGFRHLEGLLRVRVVDQQDRRLAAQRVVVRHHLLALLVDASSSRYANSLAEWIPTHPSIRMNQASTMPRMIRKKPKTAQRTTAILRPLAENHPLTRWTRATVASGAKISPRSGISASMNMMRLNATTSAMSPAVEW